MILYFVEFVTENSKKHNKRKLYCYLSEKEQLENALKLNICSNVKEVIIYSSKIKRLNIKLFKSSDFENYSCFGCDQLGAEDSGCSKCREE